MWGGRREPLAGAVEGTPAPFAKLHFFICLRAPSASQGVQSQSSVPRGIPSPVSSPPPSLFPYPNRQFVSRVKISDESGQLLKLFWESTGCGAMDGVTVGSGLTREKVPSSTGLWLGVSWWPHWRPLGYWVGCSLPEPHETMVWRPCTGSFPRADWETEAQGGNRVGKGGSQASVLLGLLDGVQGKVSPHATQTLSQRLPWDPLLCLP